MSQNPSYVFTSLPTRPNQSASNTFKDNKNPGQIPCVIGETNVYGLTFVRSQLYTLFVTSLGTIIYAALTAANVFLNTFGSAINKTGPLPTIFPDTTVTVSFEGKELTQRVENLMMTLGFRKESSAGRKYYRGPASQSAIEAIIKDGGQLDSWAPAGTCNIQGYFALRTMNTFISTAFSMIPSALYSQVKKACNEGYPVDIEENKTMIPEKPYRYVLQSANEIDFAGIFLPYFDGLLLPDRHFPAALFIRLFSGAFGTKPKEIADACGIIRNGWRSASGTAAGLMLSHALFCLDLALQTGTKPYVFTVNGKYSGVILRGVKFAIMKGGQAITPVTKEELQKAASHFDRHSESLGSIAAILSKCEHSTYDSPQTVTVEEIDSGRKLHLQIRLRTIDPESRREIQTLLKFLRFSPAYFELPNPDHLLLVVQALCDKTFLPPDAPLGHLTEALWTSNDIISTLSAYGGQAPSLLGPGTNYSMTITRRARPYKTELSSNIKLRGLPIFFKPLQQAAEDWKELRTRGIISFRTTGIDKQKYCKIAGVNKYLELSDERVVKVQDLLKSFANVTTERGEKRSATDKDDEDRESRDAKRIRKDKEEGKALAGLFLTKVIHASEDKPDEEEEMQLDE